MKKGMRPTPTVTGKMADRISKEIRNGTPNTAKRIATINRAVEVYRRSQSVVPIRDMMAGPAFYAQLDPGIRFAVRVLHAYGHIETCQSCQGGKGHCYDRPTVDLIATADDALGFAALAALRSYDLPVQDVSLVWSVRHSLPCEKLWRITFWKTMEDRADEEPLFVYGYRATR